MLAMDALWVCLDLWSLRLLTENGERRIKGPATRRAFSCPASGEASRDETLQAGLATQRNKEVSGLARKAVQGRQPRK
jgi:hypothetical protein